MEIKKREFIDPNDLMEYINENHCYSGLPMAAHICTMELLAYAPRVDVVEVVLCKDCVYYKKVQGAVGGWCDCELTPFDMDPEDFCSHGERKNNEE